MVEKLDPAKLQVRRGEEILAEWDMKEIQKVVAEADLLDNAKLLSIMNQALRISVVLFPELGGGKRREKVSPLHFTAAWRALEEAAARILEGHGIKVYKSYCKKCKSGFVSLKKECPICLT